MHPVTHHVSKDTPRLEQAKIQLQQTRSLWDLILGRHKPLGQQLTEARNVLIQEGELRITYVHPLSTLSLTRSIRDIQNKFHSLITQCPASNVEHSPAAFPSMEQRHSLFSEKEKAFHKAFVAFCKESDLNVREKDIILTGLLFPNQDPPAMNRNTLEWKDSADLAGTLYRIKYHMLLQHTADTLYHRGLPIEQGTRNLFTALTGESSLPDAMQHQLKTYIQRDLSKILSQKREDPLDLPQDTSFITQRAQEITSKTKKAIADLKAWEQQIDQDITQLPYQLAAIQAQYQASMEQKCTLQTQLAALENEDLSLQREQTTALLQRCSQHLEALKDIQAPATPASREETAEETLRRKHLLLKTQLFKIAPQDPLNTALIAREYLKNVEALKQEKKQAALGRTTDAPALSAPPLQREDLSVIETRIQQALTLPRTTREEKQDCEHKIQTCLDQLKYQLLWIADREAVVKNQALFLQAHLDALETKEIPKQLRKGQEIQEIYQQRLDERDRLSHQIPTLIREYEVLQHKTREAIKKTLQASREALTGKRAVTTQDQGSHQKNAPGFKRRSYGGKSSDNARQERPLKGSSRPRAQLLHTSRAAPNGKRGFVHPRLST